MAEPEKYDALVIGAGQSGGPLATALGASGRRTGIVERAHVGGTCINVGCTPTKTMVASTRAAYTARRASDYGVHLRDVRVDQAEVRARTRAIVESFRAGSRARLEESENVDLLFGEACFTGPRAVEVHHAGEEHRLIAAELVVINTGARPSMAPVPGLDAVGALDSTSIQELAETPEHLLVLGGGYVGLEFAQMFRRFGSRVTIVQRGEQLLSGEDADVAEAMASVLGDDGIEVLLETRAVAVRREDDRVVLSVASREGEREIAGSHVLAATGRKPNTDALDPEAAGVAVDEKGFIRVNGRLETSAPGVYAVGDVTGGPAFTHISYDDYRILRANLVEGGDRSTDGRIVPYTVFTDPQLGRVGMSEAWARSAGYSVRVATIPMSAVARAIETDEQRGMVKAVVDADTGRILGCAVLGLDGGEIAAMIQIAMLGGVPWTALRDGVFAHPTLAEGLNTLFSSLDAS